jgi:S1-C subfamily serine protease
VAAEEALSADEDLSVTLPGGKRLAAEVLGRDVSTDVVVLRVKAGATVEWRTASAPAVGSLALVVGRAGDSPLAAFGIVAESGGPWHSLKGGRIDALIRLGFELPPRAEGGAAVTPDGMLIGLAVTGPRRRTIVIPSETVERSLTALVDRGYVARGYLGVSLQRVRRSDGGVLVVDVAPGSPAAVAGLVIGDILTTWEGEPVRSVGEVARRLGADSVGRNVVIGLLRGGAPVELTIVIGERARR